MTSSSFRRDGQALPLHYRTPSPPYHDVSPCTSPGTFDRKELPTIRRHIVSNGRDKRKGRHKRQLGWRGRTDNGRDSRNAMDTFASIALAANSKRASEVYSTDAHHALTEGQGVSGRPSKRARSEKLPSPEMRRISARPVTSYIQPTERQKLEAELLLNFSREACFSVPPSQYLQLEKSAFNSGGSTSQIQTRESTTPALTPYRPNYSYDLDLAQDSTDNEPDQLKRPQDSPVKIATLTLEPQNRTFSSNVSKTAAQRKEILEASDNIEVDEVAKFSGALNNPDQFLERQQEKHSQHNQYSLNSTQNADTMRGTILAVGRDERDINETLYSPTALKDCDGDRVDPVQTAQRPRFTKAHTFLEGIEDAARGYVATLHKESISSSLPLVDALANTTASQPEFIELFSEPSTMRTRQVMVPSVCAACNFSRNALTLETENNATSWISCDACKSWFHFACAGFKNEREVRGVDKYRCRKCKPTHGGTTFVRKSARAHSAIDYAGLNEGVLKTSDENPEHHYIKPIKDGIIKFNPENFARMRAELVTAEYFQKGDGMREPIVVPAALNPRPRAIANQEETQAATREGFTVKGQTGFDTLQNVSSLHGWLSKDFDYQTVPDHGQDALDMVIPQDLTVRKVSELYGPEEKVEVIDVKSQNGEDKKWNMRRWVDYYESQGNKVVRNVISLEVSQSRLGRLIRRPKVVRDLDLQDSVWPTELLAKGDYPKVQFYCLMSVADCFTDFHIDFGGSSVFYHILKGKKTFFFIPPREKHLKKYEEWCMSPAQNWTFLGDQTKECYRVDLSEGDTMLIPAGWIHAVWTPEDSLVIGGNFLTRLHYGLQIRVAQIEKATGVARKFRYPHFQKLLWYTAIKYLEDDPLPDSVSESLLAGQSFHRDVPTHLDFHAWGQASRPGAENYHARYYCKSELDGLPELGRYLQRTALIAMGNITEGISVETRNAVKRSVPKGSGEPYDVVKKFAVWYTWKRGNEPIPHWAYPDHVPEGGAPELAEKKLSTAALRRLDREAALQAWRVAPDRQSARRRSQPLNLYADPTSNSGAADESAPSKISRSSTAALGDGSTPIRRKHRSTLSQAQSHVAVSTPSGKSRTASLLSTTAKPGPACEICRKRRRACKHRGENAISISIPGAAEVAEGSIVVDPLAVVPGPDMPLRDVSGEVKARNSNIELPLFDTATLLTPTIWRPEYTETGTFNTNENDTSHLIMSYVDIPRHDTKVEPESTLMVPIPRATIPKDSSESVLLTPSILSLNMRRCVHDENGIEDPIKVAEASMPRSPTSVKKRKVSGETSKGDGIKRVKKTSNMENLSDLPDFQQLSPTSVKSMVERSLPVYPAGQRSHNEPANQTLHQAAPTTSDVRQDVESSEIFITEAVRRSLSITLPMPDPDHDNETCLAATSPLSEVKFEPDCDPPILSSNPSFQNPPTSSLVSPPASTHTDAEHTPATPTKTQNITPSATSSSSRHSSRAAKSTQRNTPESGPVKRMSTTSTGLGRKMPGDNGSPMMDASVRTSASVVGSTQKRAKSRMGSEIEADEESMRLIRELQAQDMGLRRRERG